MTIDRTAPYDGFEGRVGRTMAGSEPAWPRRPTAPHGAANVIVVLLDDVGFSDIGCYGGEIRTPNIDRLAAEGVRLANFHVNPMCSPTRAALLTGVNAHRAGMGHIAQDDPGFPGYAAELAENVVTAAEVFKANGYATLMVGKWHLCRDSDQSAAGPQHSWPCQRGFDRFYGILEAFTNVHQPHALVEDNHVVEVDRYPDDYYLTDDLTTKALSMIKERKASNPRQPFFLYVAHPAAHAPLMAPAEDIARYADTYTKGWDAIRAERHERQLATGVIPPGTALAPRNAEAGADVPAWADLGTERQQLFARYMAVYAAMIDRVDQNMGRLRAELEAMGEWDNTVVVFLSDNGASKEGESTGSTNYYAHLSYQFRPEPDDIGPDLARFDDIGSPRTMTHYPRGWAMAGSTPFRLYKTFAHAGGHQVPCIWHWPGGLDAAPPDTARRQYGHCIDVLPTLIDLLGLTRPETRHGELVKPMDGTSLAGVLRDPAADEARTEQYYELQGNRGLYRDGWEVVARHLRNTAFTDDEYELYDLLADPTELANLASTDPERLAALARRFDDVAHENQVWPMDEGSGWRWIARRPGDALYEDAVTIYPGTPTLDRWRCNRLIHQRHFSITVAVDVTDGDRGMLVAHGDQGGGYALYLDGGHAWFVHNDGHGRLARIDGGPFGPGADQRLTVRVEAPGQGRWNIALDVHGEERGRVDGVAMPFPMAPFEGIDIGIDRRSPVDWALYEREGPFPFTGRLHWVRYEPGERAPDAPARFVEFVKEMGARFE